MPEVPKRKRQCIAIVGSRRRNASADYIKLKEEFLRIYREGDSIVSGGCEWGADSWVYALAREVGCTLIVHYAKRASQGRAAGPIRNSLIARDCTVCLAVVTEDRTGGTEDTVRKCKRLGKRVVLV